MSDQCLKSYRVFILGDVNDDGTVDIGDLVTIVEFMFNGYDPMPFIPKLYDFDGSGAIDIGDLVYLVNYQFSGGPPPVNNWPPQ